MPQPTRYEQQFLDALQAIFIGAKVEGDSGYINLMRIKATYFAQGVFPQLMADIAAACKPFEASFREELFDKLYDFFRRYFSESGSIYFRHTAASEGIYERVYTDDRDVMLFWKTHMLYYVKTDRLFTSMEATVGDERFFFDVSGMALKRANEKRELIYEFRRRDPDGRLVFAVTYSEKGRKTRTEEILAAIRKTGAPVDEETLERACRVFEKQAEVDYFINKDAKAFLEEQFDLWMYQYLFKGESAFSETRLRQLQAIKAIAYAIIGFIARFEDELVAVWNKPKFVLNSHYVITLDKILDADAGLAERLFAHAGMAAQAAEWRELGMLGDQTGQVCGDLTGLWAAIQATDLTGAPLHPRLRFLPLDTAHFPDLEPDILALFPDHDAALDGWLVHSENYQALNTLGPKFRGRVKCIHIDPPYNTATSGFMYANTYQHASWLTMMENRIRASFDALTDDGSFLCHIDENEYERLQLLFEMYSVPSVGTIIWDKRNPMLGRKGIATQHEYILWHSRQESPIYLRNDTILAMLRVAEDLVKEYGPGSEAAQKRYMAWIDSNRELTGGEKAYRYLNKQGQVYQSVGLGAPEPRTDPKFFIPLNHPITGRPCPVPTNGFSRTPDTLRSMLERNEIIFGADESVQPRKKVFLTEASKRQISSVVQDPSRGKMDLDKLGLDFPYCHPVSLYETLTGAATESPEDIILDFFAGSGTTAHAVMNLNRADGGSRQYILVEMGEHFRTVILPRVKKVAFSDKWKDGKANGGQGLSHFVKYFDLEQYEDTLRRAVYGDHAAPLFAATLAELARYVFLRDIKLLDAVSVDVAGNQVAVALEKLYPGIDLAETLSCLTGKWIKRITAGAVEFADGSTADLAAPRWEDIKPVVWW